MKIMIQTTPLRAHYLPHLTEQFPLADVICDDKKDANLCFVRCMEMVGDDEVLFFEDDALLCEGFFDRAMIEINRFEGKYPVQFFSRFGQDKRMGSRFLEGKEWYYNVCLFFPRGVARLVAEFYPNFSMKHLKGTQDYLVQEALAFHHIMFWLVVPNLADHRLGPSSIDEGRCPRRTSKTFNPEGK